MTQELRAAAIRHDGSCDVDALLAEVAEAQRSRGRRVRGLLMAPAASGGDCLVEMVLVDVDKRDGYLVSQPLGRDSKACRADPQGFARASMVLRSAAAEEPDLVVCNRFGNLERQGQGFASELLSLMARGVPLLTVVSTRHLDAWAEFTGGATVLPADASAVAVAAAPLPVASRRPPAATSALPLLRTDRAVSEPRAAPPPSRPSPGG